MDRYTSLARALLLSLAACALVSCAPSEPQPLHVSLYEYPDGRPPVIRVIGLSSDEIRAVQSTPTLAQSGWGGLMTVSVAGADGQPMAGTYRIEAQALEFVPRFPLDPGREYVVRVDTSRLVTPRPAFAATLKVPSGPERAPIAVTGVSPAAKTWPENLLRFYIHFSGPMSRATALDYVALLNADGSEVTDTFLPLDVDLWNNERTRFTVFFDPGRVKSGIRPNVELGRALHAGRKYVIAVSSAWPDANGRRLAADFRHEFVAGPAIDRGIDPKAWRILAPAAGSRDPLVVEFPWALDHELLARAIGVSNADGKALGGALTIADDDRSVRFVPSEPWPSGAYALVILNVLEDPAGNRVGRAFEFEMFQTPAAPERVTVPVP